MAPKPCTCAALRRATRRVTALYDTALAPYGISLAQFSLLRNLSRHAPLSLTELGARMELDRSTIGRNIRVIEKMGLVQAATGADQREAAIDLSPAGMALLARAEPAWHGVQDQIEGKLGADGVARLLETLAGL